MKNLIVIAAVTVMTLGNVQAAKIDKSDLVLRDCLSKVYSNTSKATKELNADAKVCREQVREMKKIERISKRKAKLMERIAKLQQELKKVN